MITIPVYELLLLPEVTFFFKKDMFPEGRIKEQNIGEEILFVLQKKEIAPEEISMENIFPVGVMGIIENIDEEGSVKITTRKRVQVTHVEYTDGMVQAEAVDLPDIQDISPEEEKEKFDKIKKELMDFAKGFQWGVWVRSMIYHWKSYPEAVSALAGYMSLSWEEKYHMIEVDSRKERMHLMEEAVYELMEIFRVSEEAETAQKNSNEKVYRESAIRKQIEFLQQQLDEMHPENISDVRRFQKKIQESGMNEEARKEAEKVLNRMKQEGKDSHEYGMLYDYLDFATSLSWKTEEPAEIDLNEAEEILNEDHYGLKKVKERIIQQLAVMALNKKQSGSILLFVGAPGTGKTSIGQSIARALHRKYVRISLGGIRDDLAQQLGKLGGVLGLLQAGLLPVHTDLGIALTMSHTGHGQIHTDLRALALKIHTQALVNLLVHALSHAHNVLGGPSLLTSLLLELLGRSLTDGAEFRGSVALVDITANGTNKLFHDRVSSLLFFCFIQSGQSPCRVSSWR